MSSRSRSRSPISTRRPSEGSKGRQRDPLRFSPHSRHTRTQHASSDTEPPDALPYTLGLYQSSSSDSDSSMVRERATRSPQHYSRRRHRPRQRGTSSSQKKRHHKHPRPSSSSSSTTSTDTESSSEFSTDSSSGRRHRHPKRKHRRQTGRLSSHTKSKLKSLSVPCCPPLPERYAARIVKGEYVSFDKLTITKRRQDFSKQSFKQPRKTVTGLASWLEAWNRFAGVIVATKPARALEMLKYQTLITTAFQDYPAEACII